MLLAPRLSHIALALAVTLIACGGTPKPAPMPTNTAAATTQPEAADDNASAAQASPQIPDQPVARPPFVVASLTVGHPANDLAEVAAFVDAVKPGAGGMLTLEALPSMLNLPVPEGIDYSKPMSVVVLDPQQYDDQSVVFVVGLTGAPDNIAQTYRDHDPDLLLIPHKGFAVIGKADAATAAAAYALTTLVAEPPPPHPVARTYPSELIDLYEPLIATAMELISLQGEPTATQAKASIEMMIELARQTPELTFEIIADATEISGVMTMTATKGSTAQKFYQAQKPATYARLGAVTRLQGNVIAAGRLDYAGLKDAFAQMSAMWATTYGSGADDVARWLKWMDTFGGEFATAMAFDLTKPAFDFRYVGDIKDKNATASLLKTLEAGTKDTPFYTRRTGTKLRHRGATLFEFKTRMGSGASAEMRKVWKSMYKQTSIYAGVTADAYLMAMGPKAKAAAKTLIDDTKKPRELDATTAAMVAQSKQNQESMLVVIDGGAFAKTGTPAPFPMGLRFSADRMQLRMAAPASAIRAIAP